MGPEEIKNFELMKNYLFSLNEKLTRLDARVFGAEREISEIKEYKESSNFTVRMDEFELKRYTHMHQVYGALDELRAFLKNKIKNESLKPEEEKVWLEAQEKFFEIINECVDCDIFDM